MLSHMIANPVLYDSHMHTPLCHHATGEPEAYAARAEACGLKGIIITCHGPSENDALSPHVRMHIAEFDGYMALVERARAAWQGRIDVRPGLECDYLPGHEAWLRAFLAQADLTYVLGSVHPQMAEYRAAYLNGDPVAFQRTYFDHLARAAETGLFDCLSHPDFIKNETPDDWQWERIMPSITAALDRIAAAGTAMELNTSGLQKRIPEMNPGRPMLVEMRARSIPVVLGSDAHQPERVGADFRTALDLLAEVGYSSVSYFLDRQRREVPIEQARASLRTAAAP